MNLKQIVYCLISFCLLACIAPDIQAAPAASPYYVQLYDIPANLSLCDEPVPLGRRDVWEMMDQILTTHVHNHAQVILWIKRAHRYFPYIEKKLKEKNLPDDLKYIVIAESSLKTYSISSARAVGPWQFLEGTAKRYGLRVDKWFDERRNFEKATDAAIRYLNALYKMHGKWGLAIAAYNCGENRISRSINMQGVNNYYDLDLPLETEAYVFRILAAKIILSYPEYYGYKIPMDKRYPPFDYDRVEINAAKDIHINSIARACDTNFKTIKEMNPELRQDAIPPGRHSLNIPRGKAALFKARFDSGI